MLTFVKGIGSGMCLSPCFTFSLLAYCSKLRATCKSASRNVKQGWWSGNLLWRGTLEEGFLLNDPQVAGKVELLQLRTVCESGAQNLKHVCLGQINSFCNCWQLAQAAEPFLLKSVSKASATMPASRKQQSGKHPFGCAASGSSMPKLM